MLDHRDQDMLNNRFGNLREADKSLNAVNTSKVRKGSKTGLQGVSWSATKGKYRARFRVGGVERLLGYWDDPMEAAAAYQKAKQEYLCTK